jgi:hypothetical protein
MYSLAKIDVNDTSAELDVITDSNKKVLCKKAAAEKPTRCHNDIFRIVLIEVARYQH